MVLSEITGWNRRAHSFCAPQSRVYVVALPAWSTAIRLWAEATPEESNVTTHASSRAAADGIRRVTLIGDTISRSPLRRSCCFPFGTIRGSAGPPTTTAAGLIRRCTTCRSRTANSRYYCIQPGTTCRLAPRSSSARSSAACITSTGSIKPPERPHQSRSPPRDRRPSCPGEARTSYPTRLRSESRPLSAQPTPSDDVWKLDETAKPRNSTQTTLFCSDSNSTVES
jgi:hypothetical protein